MILFRLIYLMLLFPFFLLILMISALFNKKIAQGLKMRIFQKKGDPIQKNPIWIHASSGEFEYAKPVITAIKQRYPDVPILVTYFSPTYARNIENFKGVDMSTPLPMDLPGPITQFINTYQPRALLFARTDLWPELLYQCTRKKIPAYVFSAVVNKNSSLITRWWREFLYKQLSKIFVVSKEDLTQLSESLQKKSTVIGDTRFDQVFARLENQRPLPPVFHQTPSKAMIVAGSTWSEDESVLVTAIKETKNLGLNWVIAAHEPTESHLSHIETQLKAAGLTSERLSMAKDLPAVLLVDRVGILAELYTLADIAFVGGSFKQKVHSVMEPLAAGCIVLVGPYHTNNGEAVLFKNKTLTDGISPVIVVHNAEDFTKSLKELDQSYLSQKKNLKEQIKTEVKSYQGATAQLLKQLHSLF